MKKKRIVKNKTVKEIPLQFCSLRRSKTLTEVEIKSDNRSIITSKWKICSFIDKDLLHLWRKILAYDVD